MKRILTIVTMTFCVWTASAQEVVDFSPDKGVTDSIVAAPLGSFTLTSLGTLAHYPYYVSPLTGFGDWSLHQGVNASLSAAAIFGLGHYSGSGFANSAALMYANNLTPKLSFAIGGYASFFEYSGRKLNDAGLTAILNYRFDDHWEAALFAQKSMVQPKVPPHLYWMREDVGDKIGATVRYNFNPSFSVSLSVWDQRRPQPYMW